VKLLLVYLSVLVVVQRNNPIGSIPIHLGSIRAVGKVLALLDLWLGSRGHMLIA